MNPGIKVKSIFESHRKSPATTSTNSQFCVTLCPLMTPTNQYLTFPDVFLHFLIQLVYLKIISVKGKQFLSSHVVSFLSFKPFIKLIVYSRSLWRKLYNVHFNDLTKTD